MIAETKLQSWEFALFALVTLSKRATRANCSQRYLLKDQQDRIALIVLYKKSDKSKSLFLRVLLFFEEKTGLWNLYHAFWLCFYFLGGLRGRSPSLPRDFTVYTVTLPVLRGLHCERCRIRTRDHCQWATTSSKNKKEQITLYNRRREQITLAALLKSAMRENHSCRSLPKEWREKLTIFALYKKCEKAIRFLKKIRFLVKKMSDLNKTKKIAISEPCDIF